MTQVYKKQYNNIEYYFFNKCESNNELINKTHPLLKNLTSLISQGMSNS